MGKGDGQAENAWPQDLVSKTLVKLFQAKFRFLIETLKTFQDDSGFMQYVGTTLNN